MPRYMRSVSCLAISAMWAPLAQAQSAEPADPIENRSIDEIVVTAQKRSEALSNIPVAVSVIGQGTLDNFGARSFGDAVSTIPNVAAKGLGGTLSIRGLGGNSVTSQANGTVAYHVDGIFQNGNQAPSQALYDIERVEVLRGPQGTLYGRNATAGVVNVLTKNASRDFEAFGDISYGNWNTVALRGVVNLPVSEAFALRLTGTYEMSDDFRSFANGTHPRARDVLSLRLATRLDISDQLSWNARVSYTWDNSLAPVGVPTYIYNTATQTYRESSNRRDLAAIPSIANIDGLTYTRTPGLPSLYRGVNFEEGNTRNQRFFSVRSNLKYDLNDNMSLTYLFGYAREKQHGFVVISGLQPYQVTNAFPRQADDWSHEIDVNFTSERLNGILGLYSFQNTTINRDQTTRIFRPTVDASGFIDYTIPFIETSGSETRDIARTRAIFGQLTYDVNERFRVTGGARYNWDRASYPESRRSQCPFGSGINGSLPDAALLPSGVPFCSSAAANGLGSLPAGFFFVNRVQAGGEKSFEKFSWKGTVDYDVSSDLMIYATVATGYKAGGPGDRQAVGDARFYLPETNISYEAGLRSKLFNNSLSLNLTGFWIDYKDLQVETVDPNNPGRYIAKNAGKARSRGLELEYIWSPSAADRISGYITYLDAKFIDFPGVDPLTGVGSNFGGNRLPGSAEFSARIAWSHTFDLGASGTITPTAQFQYQTESFILFTNTLPTRIAPYTRSDLIVRYETRNKRFSAEAFVNNIEDKLILTQIFPAFNISNVYFSQPRSYGLRLGFRY